MKLPQLLRRILKGSAWLFLSLFLLLAAALAYFTATQSGLQQSLQLLRDNTGAELSWEQADGRWLGPLQLQNLVLRQPDGLSLSLGRAEFEWQPSRLLARSLQIEYLKLSDVEIHLPEPAPAEPRSGPVKLPQIRLPLAVRAKNLDLSNIRIFPYGATQPIVIEQVRLDAQGDDDTLQLLELSIQAPQGNATLVGTLKPVDNYPLDLKLDWQFSDKALGKFNGSGTASGDLARLQLQHTLQGPATLALQATLEDVLNQPRWDAELRIETEDLKPLLPALAGAPLAGLIKSSGDPNDFSASLVVDTRLAETGPLQLTSELSGSLEKIHLQQLKLKPLQHAAELSLTGDIDLQNLTAELQGSWQHLAWPLRGAAEYASPAGTLAFNGSASDYQLELSATLDGALLLPSTLEADIAGSPKKLLVKALDLKALKGPMQLQAQGEIDLESQQLDAHGDWTALAWPMQGEANYASPKGEFRVEGKVSDYRFELDAALAGKQIPAGQWKLKGEGNESALPQFSVVGETLEGTLQASGNAAWKPQLNWQVELEGEAINPAAQWPEFPGKIGVKLTSSGQMTPQGPDLTAEIERLSGVLRALPLSGQGVVKLQGKNLDVSQLRLGHGSTQLQANGALGSQWDLDFSLKAPQLSELLPSLQGSVDASGSLAGTSELPQASLKFSADGLKSGVNEIKTAQGTLSLDLSGKTRSQLDIQGRELRLAGQPWSDFRLRGDGVPAQHELSLNLNGKLAKLATALRGGLQDQRWSGQISELSARDTEFGNWALEAPAALSADPQQVQLEALCLFSSPSRICLQGNWNQASGSNLAATLENLEAARFAEYIPEQINIDTALGGKFNASLLRAGEIVAEADFVLRPGTIEIAGNGAPVKASLGESRIKAALKNNQLDSTALLDLGELGQLDAVATLRDLQGTPQIQGTLKGGLRDLHPLSALLPSLQAVRGRLDSDLVFSGSLAQPVISGKLGIEDFAAEVPQVALNLKNTFLRAESDGGPLRIVGSSDSGKGQLTLQGELTTGTRDLKLKLKGENYQVANSRNLRAVISPDLDISMNDDGMKVTGKVAVPSAYVNAKGGDRDIATVSVSPDVVVIEANGEERKRAGPSNLDLKVRVELGDDIKVEAGDFSGALRGNLEVEQTPQQAPRGSGTIEVVNGEYVIYGQQLTMQRGRILFSGGPVDNPKLDMDVARRVEAYEVTAGARIRGTAQAPLLQLYSEPAMPDASILSYILLGQPPGTKGGSYTLGKFLTPDLYVSYGIGLFNAINTFNLRYRLTEKLSLQAASGAASSADLIYTIER